MTASGLQVGAIVLGASRSGTSLATGSLVGSGFYVGPDDDLMPANRGNPGGYWENMAVWRSNEELLAALGGSWFAPLSRTAQLSIQPRATRRLRTLLDGLLLEARGRPLVIKDPRIGVLLDLWAPVIEGVLHPVLALRNPLEVALSLAQRDGTPMPFAQASWAAHTASLLEYLHGRAVTVVRYDDLLATPEAVTSFVAAVASRLRPSLSTHVDPSAAPRTVRPALRHNYAASLDPAEYLTGRQAELWGFLGSLPPGDQVLLVPPMFRRKSGAALALTRQESERLRGNQRAELAEQASGSAERSAATAQQRATSAEQRAAGAEQCAAVAEQRATDAEQRATGAEQRAASAEQRAEGAEQRAAGAEQRLEVIARSKSWRITAPLRAVAQTARAPRRSTASDTVPPAELPARTSASTASAKAFWIARFGQLRRQP